MNLETHVLLVDNLMFQALN